MLHPVHYATFCATEAGRNGQLQDPLVRPHQGMEVTHCQDFKLESPPPGHSTLLPCPQLPVLPRIRPPVPCREAPLLRAATCGLLWQVECGWSDKAVPNLVIKKPCSPRTPPSLEEAQAACWLLRDPTEQTLAGRVISNCKRAPSRLAVTQLTHKLRVNPSEQR